MDGSVVPPGPDILCHEGEEWGEEAQLRVQGDRQRGLRGEGSLLTLPAVRAVLDEFDVVVGKGPKEGLGRLERAGVVVVLECLGRLTHRLGEVGEHRTIEGCGDGGWVGCRLERQHELRRIENLDRQASADLHLPDIKGGVGAGAPGSSPVAHGIRAVLIEQAHGCYDIAFGLAHLLAVRIKDPSTDGCIRPGQLIKLQMATHDRRKEPRADDLVRLRTQIHGEDPRPQILVTTPPPCDLWCER